MSDLAVFAPASLGPLTLRNRIIKAATFEGLARRNLVTDELVDFHRAVGVGGAGMTTLAYCAVSEAGQGAPNEIVVRPEAVDGLTRFADEIRSTGAAVSAQLGHAGPVAAATGRKGLSASRTFSPMAARFTRAATDADLAEVTQQFVDAAVLLRDSGFDCVELHFGHNYLISAFLSPALNSRTDRWGGPIEQRARLARDVATRVADAVGDDMAVIAKLNMDDGAPGGLWLDESVEVGRLLEADGALHALELTGGSSLRNPMYLFRGDAPIAEMAAAFPQPVRTLFKVFGSRFLKRYPFEEAYFLPEARQFRDALSMPLVLLGGINNLSTVEAALAEGFDFVAMGRALLRQPDLPSRWLAGERSDGLCVHCNKCMPSIYQGTHCVLVPPGERPGRRSS